MQSAQVLGEGIGGDRLLAPAGLQEQLHHQPVDQSSQMGGLHGEGCAGPPPRGEHRVGQLRRSGPEAVGVGP